MNKFLLFPLIAALFLFVSCSEKTSFNSEVTAPQAELSSTISDGNNENTWQDPMPGFNYRDTLYTKDFRIDAVPEPGNMLTEGTYHGSLLYVPGEEPEIYHYYFPPMCGDFVLVYEDGHIGRYRTNSGCR